MKSKSMEEIYQETLTKIPRWLIFDISDEKKRKDKLKLIEILFIVVSIAGVFDTSTGAKLKLSEFIISSILYYSILTKKINRENKTQLSWHMVIAASLVTSSMSSLMAQMNLLEQSAIYINITKSVYLISFPVIFMALCSDHNILDLILPNSIIRGKPVVFDNTKKKR